MRCCRPRLPLAWPTIARGALPASVDTRRLPVHDGHVLGSLASFCVVSGTHGLCARNRHGDQRAAACVIRIQRCPPSGRKPVVPAESRYIATSRQIRGASCLVGTRVSSALSGASPQRTARPALFRHTSTWSETRSAATRHARRRRVHADLAVGVRQVSASCRG